MQKVWSEEVDRILSQGIWLGSAGTRNWALDRNQALSAVEHLMHLNIGVLGGDVYSFDFVNPKHMYDSWHFDDVEAQDFLQRSYEVAKKYIINYDPSNKYFFSIVPNINS